MYQLRFFIAAIALISLTGCSRFDALNLTAPSLFCSRIDNLPYGPVPRQKLDIYIPDHVQPNAKVVVFFYGGEWEAGEKWDYRFVAKALASRGMIAVIPDYRVYPEVTFPKFVDDAALSVRWVHDHIKDYGGDPSHVYLMGHSAGAHIVALLTLDPHYLKDAGVDQHDIRAAVALSGPYNFEPNPNDRRIFNLKPGDPVDPNFEPLHFARGDAQPLFLVHGAQDDTCAPGAVSELARAIHDKGGPIDTLVYPNLGHPGVCMAFAWSFRWLDPVLDDTVNYINSK